MRRSRQGKVEARGRTLALGHGGRPAVHHNRICLIGVGLHWQPRRLTVRP